MDGKRFDRLARSFSGRSSRRRLLAGVTAVSLVAARLAKTVEARKRKRQTKRKRLLHNAYGCADVGKPCLGRNAHCCSNICDGPNPKRWQRDRSTCTAHDVGGCQAEQDSGTGATVFCGTLGICTRTTGKASSCAVALPGGYICMDCRTDAECEAALGPRAACIVCPGCSATADTICSVPGI